MPEIWGGIECTINRVQDDYFDQLEATGHYDREDDIAAIAELGVKKLRYPILWEKHQPTEKCDVDFSWARKQLNQIREAGIDPIAGLVHHGSGPAFTSLEDPEFPEKLAAYALKVAKEFPWLTYYTPVNEPLTTARFSGLYGHWYPHKKNEKVFVDMLINQLKGVVLAMQQIRTINPNAQLVQTEDLAMIQGSKKVSYQAKFENRRSWLTYDLLCGKVNRRHFFWKYFVNLGVEESALQFFLDHRCPPQIMGCNYYVTSERYLDHKVHLHPEHAHGGNGRHEYADTEAVRAAKAKGLSFLLRQQWQRYKIPIAITECHLNCTREEQMRWFMQTWRTCVTLYKENIPIVAVTAWSLFGASDWNSLLTQWGNHYETGTFDVKYGRRKTALATMIRSLAKRGDFVHELIHQEGWWNVCMKQKHEAGSSRPILITGKTGTLGQAFTRICQQRNIPIISLGRQELNVTSPSDIIRNIDAYKPWAIINTTGYVRVDDAEENAEECFRINAEAPGLIAKTCQEKGIRFMTFSSDLVFDGKKAEPYDEFDQTNPLNVYGQSKSAGEKNTMSLNPDALVIRSSAFFGPWDSYNFAHYIRTSLCEKRDVIVANDILVSPTYVPDLVNAALDIFIDEEKGIWHLSNDGVISWEDFAKEIADRAQYSREHIKGISAEQMQWKAKRPRYSVLQSEKGIKLPSLDRAMQRYFKEQTV